VVSNAVGVATSDVASLTIFSPPSITSDPVSKTVTAGSDVTFQAEVAGTGPLTYQWFFNGGAIPGATSIRCSSTA
jgi:hypothetical protein